MTDLKKAHEKALRLAERVSSDIDEDIVLAYLASMEAQGWVLVPKEATDEMIARGVGEAQRLHGVGQPRKVSRVFGAVISARPTLQESGDEA